MFKKTRAYNNINDKNTSESNFSEEFLFLDFFDHFNFNFDRS